MTLANEFAGRVALVTGAAQGIGKSTAVAFARAGAAVLLADTRENVLELAEELCATGAEAIGCTVDVTDAAACHEMVERATAAWGRLDYAFNNAGVGSEAAPLGEVEAARWEQVLAVNLTGVFHCMQAEVPAMRRAGGGAVVNNASVLGLRALPDSSLEYTAAKHGVIGLTRQAAVNHGRDGVRFVAVCPGLIETGLTEDVPGGWEWFRARTPLGRNGAPEDVARSVLALCGEAGSFVNGAALVIDGGLVHG